MDRPDAERPHENALSRLAQKWDRDRTSSLTTRVRKAATYSLDVARARAYLRRAECRGQDVRVIGRPIVRNSGSLVIGDRVWVRSIVAPVEITVAAGARLLIGPDTHINSGTTICALRHVGIGSRVEIAPYVSIYDTNFHGLYDRNSVPAPEPVVIEDDVWLCAKSTVLPGVRVGRGAVVSAHALVVRDVEPFTVVSGVPASVIKRLDPSLFQGGPHGS